MKKIALAILFGFLSLIMVGCDTLTTTQPTTTPITEPLEWIDISTVQELQAMDVTKSYRLTADLDLSGIEWNPIGTLSTPFSGWFDGNNHTISNLTITDENDHYNGLFGVATGNIQSLIIQNFSIVYTDDFLTYAGGLVAHMTGNITDVTVSGSMTINNLTSNAYVGGLVGFHSAVLSETTTVTDFKTSDIINAHASVTLDVKTENFAYVGGLVGKSYNSHFDQSSADGSLQALSRHYRVYIGGLIGHNFGGILINHESVVSSTDITIEHSYADTTISVLHDGTWASIGGLIGYNQYGQVKQSYAYTDVLLESDDHYYVGGLIGEDWNSTIEDSVAALKLTLTVDETENQQIRVSGLIGKTNDKTEVTNGFYRSVAYESTTEDLPGNLVAALNLSSQDWYKTTLLWSDETMDLDQAIAILTQD